MPSVFAGEYPTIGVVAAGALGAGAVTDFAAAPGTVCAGVGRDAIAATPG